MGRRFRWLSPKHWERTKNLSPEEKKKYWIRHRIIWKRVLKEREANRPVRLILTRKREINFARIFIPKLIWLFTNEFENPNLNAFIYAAAILSLNPAGYRRVYMNKDGTPSKLAIKQAAAVLTTPRMMTAIAEDMAKFGLPPEKVHMTMAKLLDSQSEEIQLKTAALYYKVAAPNIQVNKNLNLNLSGDKFFDESIYSNPPPIKLED